MSEPMTPLMTYRSGDYRKRTLFTLTCSEESAVDDKGERLRWSFPALELRLACDPKDRDEAQRVIRLLAHAMMQWGPTPSFEWAELDLGDPAGAA